MDIITNQIAISTEIKKHYPDYKVVLYVGGKYWKRLLCLKEQRYMDEIFHECEEEMLLEFFQAH